MSGTYRPPAVPNSVVAAKARVVSAHLTEQVLKRWGSRLGMWGGCGYPKSGTVWLCQLLAGYLDLPYAQNPHTPVAMASVIHGHWMHDARFPRTVYIVRDGRDVLLSRYFHFARLLDGRRDPRAAKRSRDHYEQVFGRPMTVENIEHNLPLFIESELTDPLWESWSWPQHVESWLHASPTQVAVVRYERLLQDVAAELGPALSQLLQEPVDMDYLQLTAKRFAFDRVSGRSRGDANNDEFVRNGIAGDWRNHFSADAEDAFGRHAGSLLTELGYE